MNGFEAGPEEKSSFNSERKLGPRRTLQLDLWPFSFQPLAWQSCLSWLVSNHCECISPRFWELWTSAYLAAVGVDLALATSIHLIDRLAGITAMAFPMFALAVHGVLGHLGAKPSQCLQAGGEHLVQYRSAHLPLQDWLCLLLCNIERTQTSSISSTLTPWLPSRNWCWSGFMIASVRPLFSCSKSNPSS